MQYPKRILMENLAARQSYVMSYKLFCSTKSLFTNFPITFAIKY